MTKYLISFPSAAMVLAEGELQAVSDASHAVVQEAKDAGVWVFGGGINESIPPVMVDGDGTVREGTYPQTAQLEVTAENLGESEHRQSLHGKQAVAAFGLHFRATDALEARLRQVPLECPHQARTEKIARSFAGKYSDTHRFA